MTGVRFTQAEGWEGWCPGCRSWWPIDSSCWSERPRRGLCRACWRELDAQRAEARRRTDAVRQRNMEYVRTYRATRTPEQKAIEAEKRRTWRLGHLEELRERARLYHAANRAKHNAYAREYRRRKHLEALDRAA